MVTAEDQTTTGTSGTGTSGTGSGSGSLPSSTGTSTRDYYPRAINNEWNYTATTGSQTQNQTTKLTSSFVDSGQTVFQANGVITSSGITVETSSFIYKSGGDYYVYFSENQISLAGYDGVQTAIPAYVTLKDNQPVGHTWSVTYDQTTSYTPTTSGLPDIPDIVTTINYDFEIAEKDVTVTVGGETFSPVIVVKSTLQSTSTAGTTNSVIFQYFAKDVGVIKTESTGTSISVSNLDSYILF